MVDQLVRSSAVDVILVDSVAALVPQAEIEGEMGMVQVGSAFPLGDAVERGCTPPARSITTGMLHQLSV